MCCQCLLPKRGTFFKNVRIWYESVTTFAFCFSSVSDGKVVKRFVNCNLMLVAVWKHGKMEFSKAAAITLTSRGESSRHYPHAWAVYTHILYMITYIQMHMYVLMGWWYAGMYPPKRPQDTVTRIGLGSDCRCGDNCKWNNIWGAGRFKTEVAGFLADRFLREAAGFLLILAMATRKLGGAKPRTSKCRWNNLQ